jgi:hypothetical protein
MGDRARYDDRPWLAASRSPGVKTPQVFAAAKTRDPAARQPRDVIVTAVSHDGARTFSAPKLLQTDGYLQYVSYLLVRETGSILMPYVTNYEQLADGRYSGRIWLRTSTDGTAFSSPYPVAEYLSYGEAGGERRWKGLGATPMAEDRGRGPHAGTVYIAWAAPLGDRLQILMARSLDNGRTWTEPARVNRGGYSSNHSSPAVAVSPDGIVAISWNDRRDDPDDDCYRPYVAMSFDGGRTFGVEQPVTTRPTCPGAGSRWMNGGETHGLAALFDGSFRIVWTSGMAGDLRLRTARVRAR